VKRLRWLITLPLAIVLIVFAVNNRHTGEVNLWPLDFVVRWPAFVFIYLGVFVGFLAGAFIAWASAAERHRRARQRQRDKNAPAARATPSKARPGGAPRPGATPPAVID